MPRFLNEILENEKSVPSSSNDTIADVMYITQEEYDILVAENRLTPKTVYMVKSLANKMEMNKSELLDLFYPVGSYYETSDVNFNPNIAWGGNWVEDTKGLSTIARNTTDSDLSTVGRTLGSKTHTLTVSQMPSHTHTFTGSSHSHSVPNHTHSIPSLSGYTDWKDLQGKVWNMAVQSKQTGLSANGIASTTFDSGSKVGYAVDSYVTYDISYTDQFNINASHNHTVTTYENTTGQTSSNTSNTTQGGTNSNTGEGEAFSIIQPSVVVIRWHRLPDII